MTDKDITSPQNRSLCGDSESTSQNRDFCGDSKDREKSDSKLNPHEGHRSRMRKMVAENGFSSLLPHQALEFLLFYGIPRKDTNEIAHELLRRFGSFEQVINADISSLLQVKGMTYNAAQLLHILPDAFSYYHKCTLSTKIILGPETLLPYLKSLFIDREDECMYLICMGARRQLLHADLLSDGSYDSVQVSLKRIVDLAIKHDAKHLILAHNHPSDNIQPSYADSVSTTKLRDALYSLEIDLMDHIIVGRTAYYSFYLNNWIKMSDGYYPRTLY